MFLPFSLALVNEGQAPKPLKAQRIFSILPPSLRIPEPSIATA